MRRAALSLLVFCAVSAPAVACADDTDDGVYGRLDGDLVLSAEALGVFVDTPAGAAPGFSLALRARYLEMTGLALGYDRAFTADRHDALWAAVDFRPVWLARFTNDYEHGPRWLDLMLDSIGIELGGAWIRPGDEHGGVGFVLGGGVELPLYWRRGDGVLLRAGARWITSHPWDAQGTGDRDGAAEFGLGVVFRTLVRTPLVGRHE